MTEVREIDSLRPFRLDSIEQEMEALVERARARAREILQEAAAEKARIVESAQREGFEAGRAEGGAEAAAAERERVARETAGLQDLLKTVTRSVEDRREELLGKAERDVVRLAMAVAERIVKREALAGVDAVAGNLRRALELVVRRHELRVLVNPADAALLDAYLPQLRREFADLGKIEIEASDAVTRGGCVAVSKEGRVDADVRTQLEEIERELLS